MSSQACAEPVAPAPSAAVNVALAPATPARPAAASAPAAAPLSTPQLFEAAGWIGPAGGPEGAAGVPLFDLSALHTRGGPPAARGAAAAPSAQLSERSPWRERAARPAAPPADAPRAAAVLASLRAGAPDAFVAVSALAVAQSLAEAERQAARLCAAPAPLEQSIGATVCVRVASL